MFDVAVAAFLPMCRVLIDPVGRSDRVAMHGFKCIGLGQSDVGTRANSSSPSTKTLSQSPMVALHGTVTHGPHGAQHLHNLHQAQPLDDGVDSARVSQHFLM